MTKIIGIAILIIGILTLAVWSFSQFVQPIIPPEINNSGILIFAALLSVVGFLAGFKDTIELFQMFSRHKKDRSGNFGEERNEVIPTASMNIGKAEQVIIQTILTANRTNTSSSTAIVHNLPQPNYGEFIGREEEIAQIARILRPYPHSQNAVVTIDGVGGIGKTALALEVAHRYLQKYEQLPKEERFEVIVWTSAKRTILTADGVIQRAQVLKTLDDIYLTILTLSREESYTSEKRGMIVSKILTQQRTLLVIDNLETVDDESVLAFLRELPAPTKAIVTTRHRIDVAFPIRLMGLPWKDAQNLIERESREKSVSLSHEQMKKLHQRTGGVPLALVWSIGLIGLGQDVEHILQKLGDASGEISRFCFEESIQRIRGKNPHKLLMALSFLAGSASRTDLGYIVGLSILDRDEGLFLLEKLSLINKDGDKFQMLPLTRIYAQTDLDANQDFRNHLETRWERRYSLTRVLLPREQWWNSSSLSEVRAPIGLISLSDLCFFELGDGVQQHMIIGGRTGSGKSALLYTIICSLASRYSHKELQLCFIDLKGLEFQVFFDHKLPHLWTSQNAAIEFKNIEHDGRAYALDILRGVEDELDRRARLFRQLGVANFTEYRKRTKQTLPRILVIIDEFPILFFGNAEATFQARDQLEKIFRLSRAFGVHVMLSSQRGLLDTSGMIRAFVGSRIALSSDQATSQELLGDDSASFLKRPGAAIYNAAAGNPNANISFQVAYPRENEIKAFLNAIHDFHRSSEL